MNRIISVAAAAALGAGLLAAPAQAAPALPNVDALAAATAHTAEYAAYRGRRHGSYRGRRNVGRAVGAAAAVGIAGALIGGAVAAQNRRGRDYEYYDRPAYGYGQGRGYDAY